MSCPSIGEGVAEREQSGVIDVYSIEHDLKLKEQKSCVNYWSLSCSSLEFS